MGEQEKKIPRIAVIGGGISGLATAFYLQELSQKNKWPIELLLLDASYQTGGLIATMEKEDCLIELGPDAIFTEKPWGLELCKKLGLEKEMIATAPKPRTSFIAFRDHLIPIPEGFHILAPSRLMPSFLSPLFSWKGKLRLLLERFIPKKKRTDLEDESVGAFVERRFGKEVLERLVQPMISGIYSVDPYDLSLRATFPQFLELEERYGSIVRGLGANKTPRQEEIPGPRYDLFISLKKGLGTLVQALVEQLPQNTIKRGMEIKELRLSKNGGRKFKVCGEHFEIGVDGVCLALPVYRAAGLVKPFSLYLGQEMERIRYRSGITVNFVYLRQAIEKVLNGFGLVVPATEKKVINGLTFSSLKFAGRSPEDKVVVRAFVASKSAEGLMRLDDQSIQEIVEAELKSILKISASCLWALVHRYPRSMPQYRVGHLELVKRIENKVHTFPGLALAGNGFYGVGIPDCIHSAEKAAEKLFKDLQS
jgi:oxygen-dependent protoporphyrinogen oxidase